MSRVGKKPIAIPAGVTVTIGDSQIEVKGPKGTLSTPIPQGITFNSAGAGFVQDFVNTNGVAYWPAAQASAIANGSSGC